MHVVFQVLATLHGYMGAGTKKDQVSEILRGKKFKLSYMPYDWGVNSK